MKTARCEILVRLSLLCLGIAQAIIGEEEGLLSPCNPTYHKNPTCVDADSGYRCQCGPGFEWNGYLCIAKSTDSRLEFKQEDALSYARLISKRFRSLEAFTIALWARIPRAQERDKKGAFLSYSVAGEVQEIGITGGSPGMLFVQGEQVQLHNMKLSPEKWHHLSYTWTKEEHKWEAFMDGALRENGSFPGEMREISGGGELILGQLSQDEQALENRFPAEHAFSGDIAFVNIWDFRMTDKQIRNMAVNCSVIFCGNAIEWVDFRSGTRGSLQPRWPSGIFKEPCAYDLDEACNSHCRQSLGPQCLADTEGNIPWPRTPAGKTVSAQCFTKLENLANRTCNPPARDYIGVWAKPYIAECISDNQHQFKAKMVAGLGLFQNVSQNYSVVLRMAKELRNWLRGRQKLLNPNDLDVDIDMLNIVLDVHEQFYRQMELSQNTSDVETGGEFQHYYHNTTEYYLLVVETISLILGPRNAGAWTNAVPKGVVASRVVGTIERFNKMVMTNLIFHLNISEISLSQAHFEKSFSNIDFEIHIKETSIFAGWNYPYVFPEDQAMIPMTASVSIPPEILTDLEDTPEYIGVSIIKYTDLQKILPNHIEPVKITNYQDKAFRFDHLKDNVNSPVFTTTLYLPGSPEFRTNRTGFLYIYLDFIKRYNISNTRCMNIDLSKGYKEWAWTDEDCFLVKSKSNYYTGACECLYPGTFALTSHMFDPDYSIIIERNFYITVAGYIGFLVAVGFCTLSLVGYSYFRCTSDTVAIHRNLAVSIILAQVSYICSGIIGAHREDSETLCRVSATFLHYLVTAEFCWLSNEAFNLYIDVTNSMHEESQPQQPMLRYYAIGWVIPAIFTGAITGSRWEAYVAEDVCWIDTTLVWLLIGPLAGIFAITCFVLIFTGKNINESSYSKDKAANRILTYHSRGCWVQIILISLSWVFAFTAMKIVGLVVQILYAFFNILQGSFFFVFFCLMDGEMAGKLAEYRRNKRGGSTGSPSLSLRSSYRKSPASRVASSSGSGGDETAGTASYSPVKASDDNDNHAPSNNNRPRAGKMSSPSGMKGCRFEVLEKDEMVTTV